MLSFNLQMMLCITPLEGPFTQFQRAFQSDHNEYYQQDHLAPILNHNLTFDTIHGAVCNEGTRQALRR